MNQVFNLPSIQVSCELPNLFEFSWGRIWLLMSSCVSDSMIKRGMRLRITLDMIAQIWKELKSMLTSLLSTWMSLMKFSCTGVWVRLKNKSGANLMRDSFHQNPLSIFLQLVNQDSSRMQVNQISRLCIYTSTGHMISSPLDGSATCSLRKVKICGTTTMAKIIMCTLILMHLRRHQASLTKSLPSKRLWLICSPKRLKIRSMKKKILWIQSKKLERLNTLVFLNSEKLSIERPSLKESLRSWTRWHHRQMLASQSSYSNKSPRILTKFLLKQWTPWRRSTLSAKSNSKTLKLRRWTRNRGLSRRLQLEK